MAACACGVCGCCCCGCCCAPPDHAASSCSVVVVVAPLPPAPGSVDAELLTGRRRQLPAPPPLVPLPLAALLRVEMRCRCATLVARKERKVSVSATFLAPLTITWLAATMHSAMPMLAPSSIHSPDTCVARAQAGGGEMRVRVWGVGGGHADAWLHTKQPHNQGSLAAASPAQTTPVASPAAPPSSCTRAAGAGCTA